MFCNGRSASWRSKTIFWHESSATKPGGTARDSRARQPGAAAVTAVPLADGVALFAVAVGAVVDPGPARLDELAGRDHRCIADDRDQVALPASFDTQDAKSALRIVKGDALDQPGQDLGRARRRCYGHPRIMEAELSGFQNSVDPRAPERRS